MPCYAIEREKYMLSQMSARLDIILHYCWLAFNQMYFSFYKETVFRCIDFWGFVMPLFSPQDFQCGFPCVCVCVCVCVCECNLMNSEMDPLSICGVNKKKTFTHWLWEQGIWNVLLDPITQSVVNRPKWMNFFLLVQSILPLLIHGTKTEVTTGW